MTAPQVREITIMPRLQAALASADLRPIKGRVKRVVGNLIYAVLPNVRLGEICEMRDAGSKSSLYAEIIGFEDTVAILTPLGNVTGLSTSTEVIPLKRPLQIGVGSGLLGRVIDSLGQPLDTAQSGRIVAQAARPIISSAPHALTRQIVSRPLSLGVRAIDGMLTCGEGQRVGIYGEPGTGKSSLLAQIVRAAKADVFVIALVGERGREVREFIERNLSGSNRARSVVVVATSDRSAIERVKAPQTAMTVAEFFRDQGARVLLVVDSVTRYARALREIGLAAGEPPTRRGFPPSVFAALPALFERAGTSQRGSITAIFTVLTEGDGATDPIAEETRGLLDGHIVLSQKLAQAGHFPAIDVPASLSRVMNDIVAPDHRLAATKVRRLLSKYREIEFLLQVGEYKPGGDKLADEAIAKRVHIEQFLQQGAQDYPTFTATIEGLKALAA